MTKDPYRYFRQEARELVDALAKGVLALERGAGDGDTVPRLLRSAHTLKGAARVVKQGAIAELAHVIEDRLATHRDARTLPRDATDELLRLVDDIRARLSELGGAPRASPTARSMEEPLETIRVEVDEVERLLRGVSEIGVQLAGARPQVEALAGARALVRTLRDRFATGRARSIIEDLDLVLSRLHRDLTSRLESAMAELAEVRDGANALRLSRPRIVFAALERATRDAAASLRRRVEFRATDHDVRLDAHVLLALQTALLHVVRNAVAHGIEPEDERSAAGKPPVGIVEIRVERRAGRVAFTCRDDGRGIDVDAVRRVALERGMIDAAQARSFDPSAAARAILESGVTTAGAVDEVSGRGVGMDVVRATASRLDGNVTVSSERGRGTVVEIVVPISLSSHGALILQASDVTAAIPLHAVRATVRMDDAAITRSPSGESLSYGGRVIPFVPLAAALKRSAPASLGKRRSGAAVVVDSGGALAAVGVDRVIGTSSVVVHALPAIAAADPVVTGASLDAEGRPQLVLDPHGLVEALRSSVGPHVPAVEARPLPVLVVDDSLTTRMLEQSILESAGYDVDLATSGEEALAMARNRRYGVFLVDVEMPGMDGFTFVAATRADPALRHVPAILVTSRSAPEDRRRGEEVGARAYVVKSEFDQSFLLNTIRDLIGDR